MLPIVNWASQNLSIYVWGETFKIGAVEISEVLGLPNPSEEDLKAKDVEGNGLLLVNIFVEEKRGKIRIKSTYFMGTTGGGVERGLRRAGDSRGGAGPSQPLGSFKHIEAGMATMREILRACPYLPHMSVPSSIFTGLCRASGGLGGGEEEEALTGQIVGLNVYGNEVPPKDLSSPFEAPNGDQGRCSTVLLSEQAGQR
ncbi:hypothetical protein HAX54_002750 [Datura stramonium]|uniref:Uncharacterized protein n=1 Tax=Datura stramonium TaxID=4076 RepID=A0ABS8T4B5_DATST|nr:hypothetical protein [Datura stramonium]